MIVEQVDNSPIQSRRDGMSIEYIDIDPPNPYGITCFKIQLTLYSPELVFPNSSFEFDFLVLLVEFAILMASPT